MPHTGAQPVLAEQTGAVLKLTLNRPERLNAWTQAMEERYFDLLAAADADPTVRAIVVTGAGRAFCAGADLDDLGRLAAHAERYEAGRRPKTFPLTIRKPLVAAINGPCAGLGLIQALYCDVRFVAVDAKLTTAFARRGLVAEHGLSWMLPRLVGPARTLDLLLSARVVLGDEAAELGLAARAVERDAVVATAEAYAEDLAANCSPRAMAAMKEQVLRHVDSDLPTALRESDALMTEALSAWPDVEEGVRSFREQRPPQFPPLARRA
jgi:enoyl-CoA hydratase/carnithine racemase